MKSTAKYRNIIAKFPRKCILVVGDIMLDRHVQGSVSRISPEAPVPVVVEEKSTYSPGGASNVAHNLCAMGAKVIQVGKIGNDFDGQLLKRELKRKGVDTSGIFVDKKICTITKTRIIAQHQQVVRIDRERPKSTGDKAVNEKIIAFIKKHVHEADAVIISDYGKGMITPELLSAAKEAALSHKKIIAVDPKVEHFGLYRGCTTITPNKKEAENAIRNIKICESHGSKLNINVDQLDTEDLIRDAGRQLMDYLELESLLLTLGEKGMMLFEKNKPPFKIETKAREVFDVTGAGDAVISTFTLALTAGATKRQAADLSNTAAGIVVSRMGAVAVSKDELLEALKS